MSATDRTSGAEVGQPPVTPGTAFFGSCAAAGLGAREPDVLPLAHPSPRSGDLAAHLIQQRVHRIARNALVWPTRAQMTKGQAAPYS